jgi:hypothetical protein
MQKRDKTEAGKKVSKRLSGKKHAYRQIIEWLALRASRGYKR